LKTEGDSKRKLSERKDPGASVGCYTGQSFPADAIQYHLRGLANGRPVETPLDEALASASSRSSAGQDTRMQARVDQARSRADLASGAARACTAASRTADPAPAVTPCITRRLRTGK